MRVKLFIGIHILNMDKLQAFAKFPRFNPLENCVTFFFSLDFDNNIDFVFHFVLPV